jgi:hypothetical protein
MTLIVHIRLSHTAGTNPAESVLNFFLSKLKKQVLVQGILLPPPTYDLCNYLINFLYY